MKWSALKSTELHIGAITAVFYWLWGSGAGDRDLSLTGDTGCFTDFDPVAVTILQMWMNGSCCFCTDPVVTFSVVSDGHSSDSCSPDHTKRNVRSAKSSLCCYP